MSAPHQAVLGCFFSSGVYPLVAATNSGSTASGTSEAINLPSGIAAGNLLIALIRLNGTMTVTVPSGWTELQNTTIALSSARRIAIFYKVASGAEGSSVVVDTGSATVRNYVTYRITNYSSVPELSSSASANSTTPDAPAFAPSWGAANCLWFAIAHGGTTVSGTPTDYSGAASFGSATQSRVAYKADPGDSENPDAFTQTVSFTWFAFTLAVKGA